MDSTHPEGLTPHTLTVLPNILSLVIYPLRVLLRDRSIVEYFYFTSTCLYPPRP